MSIIKPHLQNRVTSLQSLSIAESQDQSVLVSMHTVRISISGRLIMLKMLEYIQKTQHNIPFFRNIKAIDRKQFKKYRNRPKECKSAYANYSASTAQIVGIVSLTKLNRYQWARLSLKMILEIPDLEIVGGKFASRLTSRPGIEEMAETFLETPNSLLALQILLYTDKATAPFANQGNVHKEKVKSISKLQKAARFGLTPLIDKWAPNSLEICGRDSEGSTALHEAAKEEFEDVIERLVRDDSLSALMMNEYRKTPLHLAKARDHHGAFNILFEKACAGLWREDLRREGLERDRQKA